VGQAADIVNQFVKLMRTEENQQSAALPSDSLRKGTAINTAQIAEEILAFEKRVAQFRYGTGEVKVINAELLDSAGRSTSVVEFNEDVRINIYLQAQSTKLISLVIQILDDKKNNITGASFRTTDTPYLQTEDGGNYLVECRINLPLLEGEYSIFVQVASPATESPTTYYDAVNDAVVFRINNVGEVKTRSKVYLFPEMNVVNLD
jgi:lipopolysaccharide transport system ATP-binding protein